MPDFSAKRCHSSGKHFCCFIVCIHDVLWLIIFECSTKLDYCWRYHRNFSLLNSWCSWWQASLMNWLMLSIRVADGSWMRFSFVFSVCFLNGVGWTIWKWMVHIHSYGIRVPIQLLNNVAWVQCSHFEDTYRAFRSSRRAYRWNGFTSPHHTYWHQRSCSSIPTQFLQLPIHRCDILPLEVSHPHLIVVYSSAVTA